MANYLGLLVVLALAFATPAVASAPAADPIVVTQQGQVAGTASDGLSVYLGIPYAASPTGDRRWRAPAPAMAWKGTRPAKQYGSDCAQALFPLDGAPLRTTPSEDCLFLNVWTPGISRPGAKLPVMVWIHGGGFVNGGSSPAIYSGASFARDGVVFVSLNYRLGRFGFFSHPALAQEGSGGNLGFLDQIAALHWVQENIASFGGDPSRVTVFGESAGGMSVHMLLQSPMARGLFHAAIIQSGGGRDRSLPMATMTSAAKTGEAFAPGLSAEQLRALPADRVTGDLNMMTMTQPGYSGPMIDGRTMLGTPVDIIAAGGYPGVPVIVGANSADGFPFVTDKDEIFAPFGPDAETARAIYDPDGAKTGLHVATHVSADQTFLEPARAAARALAEKGQTVFLYRFAHNGVKFGLLVGGAPHASELPYVFDTVQDMRDAIGAQDDDAVAKLTHRYWVNFAKTGRPDASGHDGAGDVPPWPAVTAGDTRVQMIASEGARHGEDPLTARLDFVEKWASGARRAGNSQ